MNPSYRVFRPRMHGGSVTGVFVDLYVRRARWSRIAKGVLWR